MSAWQCVSRCLQFYHLEIEAEGSGVPDHPQLHGDTVYKDSLYHVEHVQNREKGIENECQYQKWKIISLNSIKYDLFEIILWHFTFSLTGTKVFLSLTPKTFSFIYFFIYSFNHLFIYLVANNNQNFPEIKSIFSIQS